MLFLMLKFVLKYAIINKIVSGGFVNYEQVEYCDERPCGKDCRGTL
jgi:hypothetical protein